MESSGFPTQDGVAVIDPRSVAHDLIPPSVMIESTMIDNVLTPAGDMLRIPPGKADIEINYTALQFCRRCADALQIPA